MKTSPTIAIVMLCLLACAASGQNPNSIVNSKHNLSVSGQGAIHATTEADVCIFCHTPHHASANEGPLWNHGMSTATYIPYSSPTLDATVGQPTGFSKLCLSCHDGTVALGIVKSRTTPIQMQGVTTMPAGPSNMGTDLSADHPVSFVYDDALVQQDSQLNDPSTLVGEVRLDRNQEMQCTSCHDPHNNQFGSFLVKDNTGSALCLDCHKLPLWPQSPHAVSTLSMTPAPSPSVAAKAKTAAKPVTVAAAACANCHTPHFAGNKKNLMKLPGVEQNCLSCHDGKNSGLKNIAADFKKISAHPITLNADTHDAREDAINPSTRHVTCSDCHNPHATSAKAGHGPSAAAPLTGVTGVTAGGGVISSATHEYELCFRCHADSAVRGRARVNRQQPETNKRFQFNPANQSFHPVGNAGRNPNVPSLIAPWTAASLITCTDCHNSDQSPAAGGNGGNGPHGSIFAPLLERQLVLTDFTPENAGSYALCYKCHSRESILGDQSFRAVNATGQDRGHRFHIVDQKTACTTCHDSHGVVSSPRLINFNTDYVTPASNGQLRYTAGNGGTYSGNCTLTCHGKDHVETSYPNPTPALLKQRRR